MYRSAGFVLLTALACASPAVPPVPPSAPPPLPPPALPVDTAVIRADDLSRDLLVFSSDEFRGRDAATPDAARAARFLAERLTALGLEPAGDSGFYQRVPMIRTTIGPATQFTVAMPGGPRPLRAGADVLPLIDLDESIPPTRSSADGDIVFGGYGLPMPAFGRNDLANLDLRGKVVVVVNGAPASATTEQRKEYQSVNSLSARLGLLVDPRAYRPAAVVIAIPEGGDEDLYSQFYPSLMRAASLQRPMADLPDEQRPIPMILLVRARAGSPFLPPGWPADDRPQPLPGRRLSARVDARRESFIGHNVVAVARGADPSLNRSYVAFGAHYDHIGILPPVLGDSVANGADDDGSGTITLLGVARAFRERPARRSALFVWHTAEEKGLLGSEYFTTHPTVPIDSIVAQINADMVGRNAPDLLYIVGPAADTLGRSRVLGQIVDSVNARLPRPFQFNREWDSPTHPERIYERSDHYSYAKRGVPIVFFTSGLHDDYHEVGDEVSKIDFDKLVRVGTLLLRTGQAIGNRPTRPR